MFHGHCECGSVAFTITTDTLRQPSACHCSQCRRTSGHVWAGTTVMNEDFSLHADDTLAWYRSSDHAERGFCTRCGSSLFYRPIDSDHVSVAMGTLDSPTHTTLKRHIFVAGKGDYYAIGDGLPQLDKW
ncbi:GFA family protein [Marimonas lutisalis]|uniref:GFA family protein n=1 Tax=Marimonas lutisalis TaxID=2545756 RepID=UPI0010F48CA4|nr:GFA family protein [Marimonas lutisalis]